MNNVEYSNYLDNETLVIFLLHGVINDNRYLIRNYNKKHISSYEFEIFLKNLLKTGNAISMDQVFHFCKGKKIPSKSFAITFDDGFQNNYNVALPILEKYNVPATIYITTDFVDRNLMSWIDRIEWAFENKKNFKIKLPWELKYLEVSSTEEKIRILDDIRNNVKNNYNIEPNSFADDIQTQLNFPKTKSNVSQLDQKLSWQEINVLSNNPLISIGGHTHSHTIMSFMSRGDLRIEISKSLSLLKTRGGILTNHYSYPEGKKFSYNDKVIKELKNHGIICCPSAEEGLNKIGTNPFELKRIFVN